MTKISRSRLIAACLPAVCACVSFKPVDMSTDVNRRDQNLRNEKMESADLEDFISRHPELDGKTKKELREGALTRRGALDRIKGAATTP